MSASSLQGKWGHAALVLLPDVNRHSISEVRVGVVVCLFGALVLGQTPDCYA